MDFYGLEPELTSLREALPGAQGGRRAQLLTRLAWYLRERDTREALTLVDESLALLDGGAVDDSRERECCRARLILTRAHAMTLFAQPTRPRISANERSRPSRHCPMPSASATRTWLLQNCAMRAAIF
jgi:hypothetical protein